MAANFPDITKKNWVLSSGTAYLPSEKLQQDVAVRASTEEYEHTFTANTSSAV